MADATENHSSLTGGGVRWCIGLFVLAVVIRLGWVCYRFVFASTPPEPFPDEIAYVTVAESLAGGAGMVDEFGYRATYMPGFPVFLSLFTGLAKPWLWARIVQAMIGACVAPLTYLLARRWLNRVEPDAARRQDAPPVLAGVAAACDPFLLFFSGLLLTETLFTVTLVGAWVVLLPVCRCRDLIPRGRAIVSGVLLLACVLLRPSSVVVLVAAVLAILIGRGVNRRSLTTVGLVLLVVIAGLTPWAARNRVVIGQWRWLTTRGGISLYDAWRPGADGSSDLAHTKAESGINLISEVEWDRMWRQRAWDAAREDPARIVRLAGRKFLRTWSLVPNVAAYHRGPVAILSGAWMSLLLICSVFGLWCFRRALRPIVILLLPVFSLTMMHMIFVGSVRYRLPVMPMVMVLAGTGLATLVSRLNRPGSEETP